MKIIKILKKFKKWILSFFVSKNKDFKFRGDFCVSDNDILPRIFKY